MCIRDRAASVSEVADGQGDVQAASVVEVDEVEVGEKLGGSVVECVSEDDVDVYKRQVLHPSEHGLRDQNGNCVLWNSLSLAERRAVSCAFSTPVEKNIGCTILPPMAS